MRFCLWDDKFSVWATKLDCGDKDEREQYVEQTGTQENEMNSFFLHAQHVIKQSKHRSSGTMPTVQASHDGNCIAPLDSNG